MSDMNREIVQKAGLFYNDNNLQTSTTLQPSSLYPFNPQKMTLTHKALVLPEKFGQFVVADFPREAPGPGEILIKVQSAALNPVDWKIQKWDVLIDGYPAVLGSDIAGDVVEVGEGVTDFKKGDKVWGNTINLAP